MFVQSRNGKKSGVEWRNCRGREKGRRGQTAYLYKSQGNRKNRITRATQTGRLSTVFRLQHSWPCDKSNIFGILTCGIAVIVFSQFPSYYKLQVTIHWDTLHCIMSYIKFIMQRLEQFYTCCIIMYSIERSQITIFFIYIFLAI